MAPTPPIVVEASTAGKAVTLVLKEAGRELHMTAPDRVALIAKAPVETDGRDRGALAHLYRTGFLPECYVPSPEIHRRRTLVRARADLGFQMTRSNGVAGSPGGKSRGRSGPVAAHAEALCAAGEYNAPDAARGGTGGGDTPRPFSRGCRLMSGTVIPPRIRVVYILGTGRCGSTLLDIILGSHPDVCSTGELHRLPSVAAGGEQPCSCGSDAADCPFWSRVIAEVGRSFPFDRLAAGRAYEFTRSLPLTSIELALPRSKVARYAGDLAQLFEAIARVSGRSVVVDSSKHSSRGIILWHGRRRGLDVRFVHLVRDGRGYIWSKRRVRDGQGLGRDSPDQTVADLSAWWLLSNVISATLFRLHPGRYLRLRYEDLVSDPAGTLRTLGRFLEIDLEPAIGALQRREALPVGHVVGGNRMRFSRALVLRPDIDWQQHLPWSDERTFWGIAGWLARKYGYGPRRRDAALTTTPPPTIEGLGS